MLMFFYSIGCEIGLFREIFIGFLLRICKSFSDNAKGKI